MHITCPEADAINRWLDTLVSTDSNVEAHQRCTRDWCLVRSCLHLGKAGKHVLDDMYEGLSAVVHLTGGVHHPLLHTALVHMGHNVWVCLTPELDC